MCVWIPKATARCVCVCVLCVEEKKIFLNSIQLYERPRVVLFLFVGGWPTFSPFIWTTTCLTISKKPGKHLDHRVRLAIFICVCALSFVSSSIFYSIPVCSYCCNDFLIFCPSNCLVQPGLAHTVLIFHILLHEESTIVAPVPENNRKKESHPLFTKVTHIYRDLIDDNASFKLPFQVKRDELTICRDIINMEWTCKHAVCRVSLLRRYLLQTHTHTHTNMQGKQ